MSALTRERVARELDSTGPGAIGMSFDDYGTGYASLSMLTEYPLTRLKIDRAFVSRMSSSPGDAAIIKPIVSLGQGFGLGVIAEGIESVEEANAPTELGCKEGQGYLFGRAMPFDEFVRHAADRATVAAELAHRATRTQANR